MQSRLAKTRGSGARLRVISQNRKLIPGAYFMTRAFFAALRLSTVVALSLPFAEQDAVMAWYDQIGQAYTVQTFGWIGWRGIFTQDPEGNTVELVAYDASLRD